MIRSVGRGIILLCFCLISSAQTLDDAVASLGRRIAARLGPMETARITSRNISSLPSAEATKAQNALARTLQKRVRTPMPVDIALTISENVHGYLLVAEIRRESETNVEMAEFRASAAAGPPAAISMTANLVWEQDSPILDFKVESNRMTVLDTNGITSYERQDGKWMQVSFQAMPVTTRDPRGRLDGAGPEVGNTYRDWRGEYYSSVELNGDIISAEPDGRIHIYDSSHAPQAVFDGWGSDIALVPQACGRDRIMASASGDQSSPDSITFYDIVNRTPVKNSEPFVVPGPVTALWVSGGNARFVVKNLSTGKYAAYNIAFICRS